MSEKVNDVATLSEFEIDQQVIAHADNDDAWEEPILVKKDKQTSLKLPADLAARAKFFAKVYHRTSVEQWLTQIILERIELEEAAFAGIKQNLVAVKP